MKIGNNNKPEVDAPGFFFYTMLEKKTIVLLIHHLKIL